jgi:hypothetical protein
MQNFDLKLNVAKNELQKFSNNAILKLILNKLQYFHVSDNKLNFKVLATNISIISTI